MAKTKQEEPKKEPEVKHDPFLPTAPTIDERMAALREDHIKMGAREQGDTYVPRQ